MTDKAKLNLMEAFKEYAKQELEFVNKADPEKVYHRIMPNFKEKDKATADFLYKKIIVGGSIDKDTIYLTKLKVTKEGKEEDIPGVIDKITKMLTDGKMNVVNNIEAC